MISGLMTPNTSVATNGTRGTFSGSQEHDVTGVRMVADRNPVVIPASPWTHARVTPETEGPGFIDGEPDLRRRPMDPGAGAGVTMLPWGRRRMAGDPAGTSRFATYTIHLGSAHRQAASASRRGRARILHCLTATRGAFRLTPVLSGLLYMDASPWRAPVATSPKLPRMAIRDPTRSALARPLRPDRRRSRLGCRLRLRIRSNRPGIISLRSLIAAFPTRAMFLCLTGLMVLSGVGTA